MLNVYRCPECNQNANFQAIGPHRSMCGKCSAVVKNTGLDSVRDTPTPDAD